MGGNSITSDTEKASVEEPKDAVAKEEPKDAAAEEESMEYPSGKAIVLVIVALYLSLFLVALDRTIISTAIPRITDDFNSLGDVGWYGSAYLICNCGPQLLFGRIYTFYSPKWVFLTSIILFEVGSALCGAAPTSIAFIVGRSIAGVGSAGIFSGAIVLAIYIVPLHKRPLFQGFFAAIFGVASVAGPLLGGVFADRVSWRWCFYINLPIGAVTFVVVFLILKAPSARKANTPIREQISQLDPLGNICFLPGIICLLLALQWGGSTYTWNDGRIIALLVLFGLLIIAFIAIQIWKKESATVPPRIISQRSIASGLIFNICIGASMFTAIYFIPIWFQAIKNESPVKSGFMLLPMIIPVVVGSIITGALITVTGYYTPFMIVGSMLIAIGSGLFTTFQTDTGHAKWIGYQVIFGLGLSMAAQRASVAAQTVLKRADVPTGVALMFFGQTLGGAVFVSVGENVFSHHLESGLSHLSGLDLGAIANTGATEIRKVVPPELLSTVLTVYNKALTDVFIVTVITSCLSIIPGLAMEWKSVKEAKQAQMRAQAAKASKV